MYGTHFMSKSLAFIWCWLGTKVYHGVAGDSYGKMLEELSRFIDEGKIKCHMTQRLRLTVDGLRNAHGLIETGKCIGKVSLGVDEEGSGEPFT